MSPSTRRRVRSTAALGLTSALLLTATGCFGDSRPSPQEAATALASAVASGDYSSVPLTAGSEEVPEHIEEALAELDETEGLQREVSVGSAEVDGEDSNLATATLTVDWNVNEALGGQASPSASPTASPTTSPTSSSDSSDSSDGSDGSDNSGNSGSSGNSGTSAGNWSYQTTTDLRWDEEAQEWLVDLTPQSAVPELAEGGTVHLTTTPAERGSILDGENEPLMMERNVAILGLDKARVESSQIASAAQQVADVAGVNIEDFVARAEAAGDEAFIEAITLRVDGATYIPENEMAEIPGGRIIEDTAVLAPTRSFARDVLGTFGEPNAEQIEASDGELTSGVEVGLSGLQATWEDRLAGTPGVEIRVDNEGDDADRVLFTSEPVPGQELTSTLNRDIQREAEAVVAASDVPAGLVAMRPSDGHVLAAASSPEGWPVAVSGSFAPGSTFKVVTSLALLRSGMTADTPVQCPATINVNGMVVGNYDEYPVSSVGEIPFSEAFAQSCNTVFVGSHEEVTSADEAAAANALGLAEDPETGLDSVFLGSVPKDSTGTEHAANLFGQGVVEASPLGMATVAASVAAGKTVRPVFVSDPAIETAPAPENGITEEEAEQLRELMSGVVSEGTATMLQEVPGAPVLAKTGTAQFVADGEDLAHTWLIAIHGDLAVALFFNEGLGGGHDNGPVVADFLTEIEEIMPSEG
ncbi:penicillin-binding transpeptidase domain-containing protein [Citricoccus sp. GCM10030269]|uniref:penicillin-binding transpeptidase domain-containing protein n=1 Tax=Citricoccus sp. GCM10030269 TaxID=3273388 RepID=UPI003616160F